MENFLSVKVVLFSRSDCSIGNLCSISLNLSCLYGYLSWNVIGSYMCKSGAHNPERATSCARVRSFHGPFYFKNDFGAKFEYLLNFPIQSAKCTDLKMIFFAF